MRMPLLLARKARRGRHLLAAGLLSLVAGPLFAAPFGEPSRLIPPADISASNANPTSSFGPGTQFGPPAQFVAPGQLRGTVETTAQPAAVNVPIPRPNPRNIIPAKAATAQPTPAPPPTPAKTNSGPPTRLTVPVTGPMLRPDMLNQQQRDSLVKISNYFNNVRTMKGDFIQIGPNGEQSEGQFFLSRPGKIRFHYKPPVRVDVIADGRSVAVEDRSAMTQNIYPLSKTPLKHLLAERIDLGSDRILGGYREEPDAISLVLAEPTFGDGKLTMIFDRNSYELKQWVITDAQGLDTSVAIYNVEMDKQLDPQMFKIYISQDFR